MEEHTTVLHCLKDQNTFYSDPNLQNVVTGVYTHHTVNVNTAEAGGGTILNSMDGKTSAEYTFRRKDQVVTLSTKFSVKIDDNEVQVDPQLLFQRLITAAKTSDDLKSAFKYDLCSNQPALIDL